MKDHTRSLRTRVGRLEARQPEASSEQWPPPNFWDVLCGIIPPEGISPELQKLVDSCFVREERPDPLEEELTRLEHEADSYAGRS